MRAVRPLGAAAGARDCAPPAVAGARRAAAEYQPGYDGLPGGAQGPRALASMTIKIMMTTRTLLGSTKLAAKLL